MQQSQEIQVPHLKADAQVQLTFGTGFIERVNDLMTFLLEGKEDEVKVLQDKKGDYKDNNPWEDAVVTVTTLMKEITTSAEATGQVEYRSLSEMVPGVKDTPVNQDSQ